MALSQWARIFFIFKYCILVGLKLYPFTSIVYPFRAFTGRLEFKKEINLFLLFDLIGLGLLCLLNTFFIFLLNWHPRAWCPIMYFTHCTSFPSHIWHDTKLEMANFHCGVIWTTYFYVKNHFRVITWWEGLYERNEGCKKFSSKRSASR